MSWKSVGICWAAQAAARQGGLADSGGGRHHSGGGTLGLGTRKGAVGWAWLPPAVWRSGKGLMYTEKHNTNIDVESTQVAFA